jgi:hypothetical protein
MKELHDMTDAEVLLDQAGALRERAAHPDCIDPRVPLSRADRFEQIAAKLDRIDKAPKAKSTKIETTYDDKKRAIAGEVAAVNSRR